MKKIVKPLLDWYQENKRVLPWREDADPYHIWISEVMLQQTRIEAVIPYYKRFMRELPTILDLAQVEEDRLLKLWEGLGYYNRARNLKKAACEIVSKYHGAFPNNYEKICDLPGIGEYTASAIASICFSLKEVTVDGNVLRVYMRLRNSCENIDSLSVRKEVRKNLMTIIPKASGNFNQALMELGEVICLPNGVPKCNICPLQKLCKAKKEHTYLSIPIRNQKQQKKNQKYTVLLFICGNKIALHKRGEEGLLKNLWEFPNISGDYTKEEIIQYLTDGAIKVESIVPSISYTHVFTHVKWQMKSYIIKTAEESKEYIWKSLREIKKDCAIPSAFQTFLNILEKEVLK